MLDAPADANAAAFDAIRDDVFSRIASRYDVLCDLFSLGLSLPAVRRARLSGCCRICGGDQGAGVCGCRVSAAVVRHCRDPHGAKAGGVSRMREQRSCLEICRKQIVGAPAAADIHPGGGGAYAVAVGVERVQKTRFIGKNIRLKSLQRVFADEKRCLDRAVMSPEPYGTPRVVIGTAVIWKFDHLDHQLSLHGTRLGAARLRQPSKWLVRQRITTPPDPDHGK
jgi:hypothetical protein